MNDPARCEFCGALLPDDGRCEACRVAEDGGYDRATQVVLQQEVPTHELPSPGEHGSDDRTDAAELLGGLIADRYRIMGVVGRGGFGLVLRALDQRLGRLVALKLLDRVQGAPPEELLRFEREARILASLDHPGIVPVYDVGVDAGRPYIAMKLVRGPSLARRLQGGPLPIPEALRVVHDVAGALEHAHARGVLHRDVKPSNILVERDGSFILADFGISSAAFLPRITLRGIFAGTLDYLAPEVLTGKPTEVSDLYALGAVLHEMLFGRTCFQASDMRELLAKIAQERPPALDDPPVPITATLRDLLERLLAKEAVKRPSSATALREEISPLLREAGATYEGAPEPAGDLPDQLERVERAVEQLTALCEKERPDEDAVLTRASGIEILAGALCQKLVALTQDDEGIRALLVSLHHLVLQVIQHVERLERRAPSLLGYRIRLQKSIVAPIRNVLLEQDERRAARDEDFFAHEPHALFEPLRRDWIDDLRAQSDLKRHEAVLTIAGAGQASFLAHLRERSAKERDELIEALWQRADVLLLEGRGRARPVIEEAVALSSNDALRERWQQMYLLFRREAGGYIDVAAVREILEGYPAAEKRVFARSFLFHPASDYRHLAMELLDPPDYWQIVSHTETPIPWLLEIWRHVKPRVTQHYLKVFFACVRETLRAPSGPDRLRWVVEMLKELYQVDAFHESSFFNMLMDLDDRVRAAGRAQHLLIDFDAAYVERFREFLQKGPSHDNPIEGWTKVPLPIQRLLARRGYFLKHFVSHPIDPIALECLLHLRVLENVTPYVAIYSINARLLVELAKDQRLFRGEEPRLALVSNPKAPTYVVLKYISLLRRDSLQKIASSRECNQLSRGYAVKILGRSEGR